MLNRWLFKIFRLFQSTPATYYRSIMEQESLLSKTELLHLLNQLKLSSHATDTIIRFHGISFNSNKAEARQILGEALDQFSNQTRLKGHEILLYKMIIGRQKAHITLHYLEDKLFLVKVSFRSFAHQDKVEILSEIAKKYLDQEIELGHNQRLGDITGNMISIQDAGHLNLYYICGYKWPKTHIVNEISKHAKQSRVAKRSIDEAL